MRELGLIGSLAFIGIALTLLVIPRFIEFILTLILKLLEYLTK